MNFIIPFIGAIFETYIANLFFTKFGKRKISSKNHYIICLLYIILQTANSLLFNNSILMFILAIILTFILCCFFEIKMSIRIVVSLAYSIIMALSESAIVMFITMSSNIQIAQIQENMMMYLIVLLLSKFLSYVVFYFIKPKNISLSNGFTLKFMLCIFVLPFSSIFIIVLLYIYSFENISLFFQITTFIAAILLLTANMLTFYILDKQEDYISTKNRLLFAENHIKNQTRHYTELYEQQQELKKFKHDSKNLYVALLAKIGTLSEPEAISEIENKMNVIFQEHSYVNSGNPIIDAVLTSKIAIAQKMGIEINTSIKIITTINIDELELAVLIGNALDNSIEATQLVPVQSNRIIRCSLVAVDEMISFNVLNPVIFDINTDNLITTKKDKRNHGYGISGIKTIVKKYNGLLSIDCKDKVFSLSATIKNKKP